MSDSEAAPTAGDPARDQAMVLIASENANNENHEIEARHSHSIPDDAAPGQPTTEPSTGPGTPSTQPPTDTSGNTDAFGEYAKYVTYESGQPIYTDPESRQRYTWDAKANNWIPENEHYRWDAEKNEWVLKEPQQLENDHYRWCPEAKKWFPKFGADGATIRYEDGERLYTDKDGMTFFWDEEKSAWFPKITEDFMAVYQMNYGFIDNTTTTPSVEGAVPKSGTAPTPTPAPKEDPQEAVEKPTKGKRKAPEPPSWFELDPEHNTKVYVSNLPLDITEEEFVALMSKCGMVTRDIRTQKLKVKLYQEPDGSYKGDGLCDYIKMESVELALNILDGMDVRGKRISVTRAKFQMRGDYDPKLKPRKKQKKEKEKEKKLKEKLFDWRPDKMRGDRAKHERTVVIKNLFHPEIFDQHVERLLEYQRNLREECAKCGTVRKVVVYDRHPDGVAQVTMADPEEADIVVQLMNRRQFGDRVLQAETWDGKTRYRTDESKEDAEKRIQMWNEHLARQEEEEEDSSADEGVKEGKNGVVEGVQEKEQVTVE